jgi:hypothetical protein
MSTIHFIQRPKRIQAELTDRRLKQDNPPLQRLDGARVQAELEVLLIDPIVDGSDVTRGHDGK